MTALGLANAIQQPQLKAKLPQIQAGDTVRVHQLIREGAKTRTQVFEGLVIRIRKPQGGNAFLTVRKIASGVGVEKSWFLHSPNVEKIEVLRRSKVRRAFLTYMRERQGKSARLAELDFNRAEANAADHRTSGELEEAKAAEKAEEQAAKDAAKLAEAEETADAAVAPETDEAVVESTEDLAREENKQADADARDADDATDGDDEQELAAAETNEGLDRADDEDDKSQAKS